MQEAIPYSGDRLFFLKEDIGQASPKRGGQGGFLFSRYNMNTGVLTEEMVERLFGQAKALLAQR